MFVTEEAETQQVASKASHPHVAGSSQSGTLGQEDIEKQYSYWRFRLLLALIIGYSAFYIVRQNMSIAVPGILDTFGYTKTQVGWIFTSFSVIYGISKFISGTLCDRSNARIFMTVGLLGAAAVNLGIGFSNSIIMLGVFYGLNGWFQSMGWPPCTRILTHWYGPRQLGSRWGICNASHQIGSSIILIGGPLLLLFFSWRSAFIIPSVVCSFVALYIYNRLRDTPKSLGLPCIESQEGLPLREDAEKGERATLKEIFLEHILPNKPLWYVCIANFFVYIVRMGFFNWAPTFLKEMRGISLLESGFQTTCFEIAGLVGGLAAGWLSDHIFNGFRGRVSAIYMTLLIGAILLFWYLPTGYGLDSLLMFAMGFLIYGPQVLIGVAGAEFGTHKAACAAAGFTGTFGYLGGAVSGVGVGYIAEHFGWGVTLGCFVASAIAGVFFLTLTWNRGKCPKTGVHR